MSFANRALAMFAVAAAIIMALSAVPASDAIGEDLSGTYGSPTNIDIAPGYQWRYTAEFPSDLTEHVTVSLKVNDGNIGSVSGKSVTVTIPKTATVGTVYNVVIQASMTQPVSQTSYQYVTFTVVAGLSVSGTINDIIKGSAINFTPTGSSSMGSVVWSVTSGHTLPAGLTLSGGKVTGTPTNLGLQTVYLTATANGQSATLEVSFTVYSKIVGGSAQTISSYGTTVSSDAIENASDIAVTWKVTSGTMPSGFSLNKNTGVVSGSSTEVKSTTLTLTGTAGEGPSQTATKKVTIKSEPALTLTASASKILTYKGNATEKTVSFTAPTTSSKTWTVTSLSGVTVEDGVLKVKSPTKTGMSQSVTVTCKTAYGQTATKKITLAVEDTLSATGDSKLSVTAGTEGSTSAFTVSGGSDNSLSASTTASGLTVRMADGKLYAKGNAAAKDLPVVVTITSAAGQTVTKNVTVDVYSQLVFTSLPTGGAIIYAV